jgi:Domain of Unknown Function (DUF1206)
VSDSMSVGTDRSEQMANSTGFEWAVRAGIVCFGLVHLLIAWIALNLAFGQSSKAANQTGALRTVSDSPLGAFLLWAVAVGFVALVVWQALEARRHLGLRSASRPKQTGKAVGAMIRAVVYAVLAVTSARIAMGAGNSSTSMDHVTRELMKLPAGPLIVGVVGVAVIGVGIAHAVTGIRASFVDDLDDSARGQSGRVIVPLGRVGFVAKGISFGVVGALFVTAAATFDPKKAGGLDVALRTLLDQPYGKWLLTAVALGIGCFGVYCFAWARDVDPSR